MELVRSVYPPSGWVRLVGVTLSNISPAEAFGTPGQWALACLSAGGEVKVTARALAAGINLGGIGPLRLDFLNVLLSALLQCQLMAH